MAYETLLTDLSDGIFTLTLNRPDRLNAFTATMMTEYLQVLDEIDANDDVRVVIVTGAGRGFCAGADLGGRTVRDHVERSARRVASPQHALGAPQHVHPLDVEVVGPRRIRVPEGALGRESNHLLEEAARLAHVRFGEAVQ